VTLTVNDSGDSMLVGKRIRGLIVKVAADVAGNTSKALVRLDDDLDYCGHYRHAGIRAVVASPYLRWHGLERLLVTSSSVRVVDAEDFTHDDDYSRIVALASMRLIRFS
jgi:hypothetical protein